MSAFKDGSYDTLAGKALIAKVLAGRCKMKYTKAQVGKGTIPADKTPKTMTECAGYVMDAQIVYVTSPADGECQVTVQINSANVEETFLCTNVVLFAEDPDLGDVAFTYTSLENDPETVRSSDNTVGKMATFDLIAVVDDVDTVEAVIDPEAIPTVKEVREMIEEHNTDPDSHGLSKLPIGFEIDPEDNGLNVLVYDISGGE